MFKEYEKIYEDLKQKIVWLELKPERVLNVSELAEDYGVSRTPLKEALIFLQAEGWVLRQGSYFLVTPLSLERIRETTEIRMIVEVQANILAMQRIREDELIGIKNRVEEFRERAQKTSNRETVELDFTVHQTIFKATRNSQMALFLEKLLGQYLRFWLSIPRDFDKKYFIESLSKLVAAFEQKNESQLIEVSRGHIQGSVHEITRYYVEPSLYKASFDLSA